MANAARPVGSDASAWLGFLLDAIGSLPILALAVVIIGTTIAFPWAMIGAMLLAKLGEGNVGSRLPVFWTLVGGLAAGLPALLFTGGRVDWVLPFAFTGSMVASICRWRADWRK